MKTYLPKVDTLERNWILFDAEEYVLGRLASEVAQHLSGKKKAIFTPFLDTGDFVVVINAEKINVTGQKLEKKMYHHHSGYMGGLKSTKLKDMLEKKPEEVIRLAVKRMLPKNKLGRQMYTKLKVYAGPEHPHDAQAPAKIES